MPTGCVIGHRGAPRLAPENSLEGFRAAARGGVRWIETDASLLGDGTVVISHDGDLQRLAGRPERLSELSVDDLDLLGVAGVVPTLDAALRTWAEEDLSVNLEIKSHEDDVDRLCEAVLHDLERHRWADARLLVSSFDFEILRAIRAKRETAKLGILCEARPDDWKERAAEISASAIHPDYRSLSAAQVREMRDAGLEVNAWTVNSPDDALRLWNWGVQGVISDDPVSMLGLRD